MRAAAPKFRQQASPAGGAGKIFTTRRIPGLWERQQEVLCTIENPAPIHWPSVPCSAPLILLLAFTPLGLIDLPLIKATILHVPVIIGAVLLGWRKGALLGGVFGLASLVKNTIAPSALSFAFSPFIPVPGTDRGSIWALVICLIPRILTGITPALVYAGVRRCFRKKNLGVNTGAAILAGIAGALTNTVLVMGLIFLVFRQAYAALQGISVDAVLGVILGIVGANGVPEAIAAAILTPAICVPLGKALRLDAQ